MYSSCNWSLWKACIHVVYRCILIFHHFLMRRVLGGIGDSVNFENCLPGTPNAYTLIVLIRETLAVSSNESEDVKTTYMEINNFIILYSTIASFKFQGLILAFRIGWSPSSPRPRLHISMWRIQLRRMNLWIITWLNHSLSSVSNEPAAPKAILLLSRARSRA